MTSLIIYRGLAGDRNARGMAGAELLGAALAERCGLTPERVGSPRAPLPSVLWREQLSAAQADLRALAETLRVQLALGRRCVSTMGRCAAGLATLPAVAQRYPRACVVWFDAHGDSNLTDSRAVPYLGGMVISGAAGLWDSGLGSGLQLSDVVLVGARDLDPYEEQLIASGALVHLAPGPHLPERLAAAVGARSVYVHLDCDVLEPGQVPFEYEVRGGLSLAELRACFEVLARNRVIGVEIAELEAQWLDGRPADPRELVETLTALIV